MKPYIFKIGAFLNEIKTPYELWLIRKTTIKNFKVFGNKHYIKRIENILGKFEDR